MKSLENYISLFCVRAGDGGLKAVVLLQQRVPSRSHKVFQHHLHYDTTISMGERRGYHYMI